MNPNLQYIILQYSTQPHEQINKEYKHRFSYKFPSRETDGVTTELDIICYTWRGKWRNYDDIYNVEGAAVGKLHPWCKVNYN